MEIIEKSELTPSCLNGVYKDISEEFSIETALKFYEQFKGLQITFPVRLLSKEYVKIQVKKEYNGGNIKELVKKYSYSERWLRKIIDER